MTRDADGIDGTIVGDECHIVAKSTSGARGTDPIPGGSPDGYGNLILLCARHHRLVDDQPEAYPVARLLAMKAEHEAWVRDGLGAVCGQVDRRDRLSTALRESRARCIERWQALGIEHALASSMSDSPSVGRMPPELARDRPVAVLVGDVGSGKSLAGERAFQEAISDALERPDAPAPVWLRARDALHSLSEAVDDHLTRNGLSDGHGPVFLVIDGLDETGPAAANALLSAARILVNSRSGSRALLTTRLLEGVGNADERVRIPPLDIGDAERLIARVSGSEHRSLYRWPQSVREAATRPGFAIALAVLLRADDSYQPAAPAEVIDRLVRRALGDQWRNVVDSLVKLAVASLQRAGGPVGAAEIAPPHGLHDLLATRLIVEEQGRLRFPLILFAQWFASLHLQRDDSDLQAILDDGSRLDAWRYPFAVAIASGTTSRCHVLMETLARRSPAFGSLVITEVARQYGDETDDVLNWQEAGRLIRQAEDAWVHGLGSLAEIIAPVHEGRLRPLGVRADAGRLTTAWYRWPDEKADVFELDPTFHVLSGGHDYGPGRSARVGRSSAWPWQWTHHELGRSLQTALRERRFPMSNSPLEREAVWEVALHALDRGTFHREPLDVRWLIDLSDETDAVVNRRGVVPVRGLSDALRRLVDASGCLHPPWVGPERMESGPIWGGYSHARLVARAQAVYEAALNGYSHITSTSFAALAPRMQMAVRLPGTARGIISFSEREEARNAPLIEWWLEPAAAGPSRAAFVVAADTSKAAAVDVDVDELTRRARPSAASWLHGTWTSGILDIFHLNAAQRLMHQWLWDDLKTLGWLPSGGMMSWDHGSVPTLEAPSTR